MRRFLSFFPIVLWLVGVNAVVFAAPPSKADLAQQRMQFQLAWRTAQKGAPLNIWRKLAVGLETYPLYPYIELAALQRRLPQLHRNEVEAFFQAWPNSLPAQELRNAYLTELAKTEKWQDFLALYRDSKNRELQCNALKARLRLGQTPDFTLEIQPLWLSSASLPTACDEVFAWARKQGKLEDGLVWQRITLAANVGNSELVSALGTWLNLSERETAERTLAMLRDPAITLDQALSWPDTPRLRDVIVLGLKRAAKQNSDSAETAWTRLSSHFQFDTEQRNTALRALALSRAIEFSPNALARLAALPSAAHDDTTREWRVRNALMLKDWGATLEALDALSETQRADQRWRYLRARTLSKLNRPVEAEALLIELARAANFYGFLAADWLKQPYSICPLHLASDAASVEQMSSVPGLARAFEFFQIGRLYEARREWDYAITALNAEQRRLAVAVASTLGWHDRAAFTFTQNEELRLYELRFPLARRNEIEHEATQANIDPALVYAIIRAESAWMTDAHSKADAYGLMQLLPRTAAELAKAKKIHYSGATDLYQPGINIQIGAHYLSQLATQYQGSPWLISAAYNAGKTSLGRWLAQRDGFEPDFFIETIPYKETREYVARVLAFTVIYDWRLHNTPQPLSARMPRIGQIYTPPDEQSIRKEVICPSPSIPATPLPITAKQTTN